MEKVSFIITLIIAHAIVFLAPIQSSGQSSPHQKVKMASLSYVPVKWDKAANIATIEQLVEEAVVGGAECIITPEGGLEGYLINVVNESDEPVKPDLERRFKEIAESEEGENVLKIKDLARKHGVDIVLGFLERDGDILYNTSAWINAQGKIIHKHRKTQMAQEYFTPEYYHPGNDIDAFDTRFGRMGIMICYERQVPEVARVLALAGASIILNPSYGGRGEWNSTMLRARARDNDAWLIFTHPKQTLVIDDGGEMIVYKDHEDGPGVVFFDVPQDLAPGDKLGKRRPEVFAKKIATTIADEKQPFPGSEKIKVASVQIHSVHSMDSNVNKMIKKIEHCASSGVQVALFHECATTGYYTEDILRYTEKDFIDAERRISLACKAQGIYVVYGSPYYEQGTRYNMGIVINDQGETIYRQAKIQLVGGDEGWARPGTRLSTFKIGDKTCSMIICHDSRYPELVRLPVMKGSRLVFYMSSESNITRESKIIPYRAQVVARAVENNVYVVQSNEAQNFSTMEGSHGQSRIVAPDGVLLQEASIFGEDVLIVELDLSKSSGGLAKKSLQSALFKAWWEEGLKLIGTQ
ncbi:MAG: carbon-nitrogen hydrolase family protein [Saprospiraceae bacterium]|nr:carbon-nitrogen hydrolase family protein [Saprospiraceae bacterium]